MLFMLIIDFVKLSHSEKKQCMTDKLVKLMVKGNEEKATALYQ